MHRGVEYSKGRSSIDARNKRAITPASRTFFGYGLHDTPETLLEGDDDEGRAYYGPAVLFRLKLLAGFFCAVLLAALIMPQ